MSQQPLEEKAILDQLGIGVFHYVLRPKKKFVDASKAFLKMLGYGSLVELENCNFEKLIVDKKDKDQLFETLKKKKKIKFFETTLQTKKNKIIWVTIGACSKKEKGKREVICGVVQLIPAGSSFHEEGSNGADPLQTFLDSIPDAIYFKDRKNRITRVNEFYAKGFGGRTEKIIGKTADNFFVNVRLHKFLGFGEITVCQNRVYGFGVLERSEHVLNDLPSDFFHLL